MPNRLAVVLCSWLAVASLVACGRAESSTIDAAPEPDAPEVCAAPKMVCGDRCVDPTADTQNCGGCGTVCKSTEVCVGHCELACKSSADCPSERVMCADHRCLTPRDCSDLHSHDLAVADGTYLIDPDGSGPVEPFTATCDMTTDGGGWTIVAAFSGADGEQPLTSDTEASGDPFRFAHYNLNLVRKMALSATSTESVIRARSAWLKVSAPLFDDKLATPNTLQEPKAVTLQSSDGALTPAYMSYVNYNITQGGDFGIAVASDAPTCGGAYAAARGFDHHNPAYHNLNCGCERQYLYSYSSSSTMPDGDAGYDVNTGLGAWAATATCNGAEGGSLAFYAAMRHPPASCAEIRATYSAARDGVYTIDPDGAGGAGSGATYCDMTTAGGNWTLLLSAKADSTSFGNASPTWKSTTPFGTAPTTVSRLADDFKAIAYANLPTNEIRLCLNDLQHCHVFAHGQKRTLYSFFQEGKQYDEYSFHMVDSPDTGTDAARVKYLTELGVTEFSVPGDDSTKCRWLGINQVKNQSVIGLMGDADGGCVGSSAGNPDPYVNDLAIGLGLQSCGDGNGCAPGPGPSAHHAGHSRRANGKEASDDLGPWFVFGR